MSEPTAAPFAPGAAPAPRARGAPLELAVVVDTEEEFDWSAPFARENRETLTIPAQAKAHAIFDRFGIVPTYVIDHPVASDPAAAAFLRGLADSGRAEIGAHLHPWVTPPFEEAVTSRNSYHGNLPPDLERAKIATLTETVAAAFGGRPTVFKAGRYGFGPHTAAALVEQGYEIDCSFVPHMSFAADGGPSFYGRSTLPFWLDSGRRLLEIPLTSGFTGPFAATAERRAGLFDSEAARRLHIPGILARLGLAERIRLSPEGHNVQEQCRLLATLVERGQTLFTLAYHSPSLAPGHSPYVRTEADLAAFLANLEAVLAFFQERLGGRFTTLTRYRARLGSEERAAA
jgi:hypothetical protein